MKEENYRCAVECYTKAIDLDLRNAVYYCNRYSQRDFTPLTLYFCWGSQICLQQQKSRVERIVGDVMLT